MFTSGSTDRTTRCVDITIIDDGAFEGDQTFTVALSTADLDVMLRNSMIAITITDNYGLLDCSEDIRGSKVNPHKSK